MTQGSTPLESVVEEARIRAESMRQPSASRVGVYREVRMADADLLTRLADRVEELETALEHIAAEGCPMPPFFDRAANREPCGKCANCIARQALSTQPHQDNKEM